MDQRPDTSVSKAFGSRLSFWALVLASLLPWFYYRVQQITNSDVLWLCDALRRVFSGLSVSQAAYDPNPPLSMLIYTLPVLAQTKLHLPLHDMVFAQTLALTAFFSWVVWRVLRRWDGLSTQYADLLTAAYILAGTYSAGLFLGERDHYLALALIPFVLIQLSITRRIPLPARWTIPALALGAILILLKPHHGLIPTILLAHRVLKRKNVSVLRDADFLALAIGCISYAAIIYFYFPDFVTVILPDVLRLYLPYAQWNNVAVTVLTSLVLCAVLVIGVLYTPEHGQEKREQSLTYLLAASGLLSLIPYYVQGLGLYYHLLPAVIFFSMAYAGALFAWAKALAPKRNPNFLCFIFMLAISLIHAGMVTQYPTHANYKDLPLPALLTKECPKNKPCSFYMLNFNMGMVHEAAYYTGTAYASRFPSLWFRPSLTGTEKDKNTAHLSSAEKDAYFKKYSAFIAADLSRGKPDILVLLNDPEKGNNNFIPYFSKNKDFAAEMRHYKRIEVMKMSYDEHYKGVGASKEMRTYDIYKRISR